MTAHEIRSKYLEFFKSKGHTIIPSASLIPQNDASVLFTTAGMHPLVPYLLGEKHPGGTRVTDSQKCVRTTDIDEVGDNRHLTFFEMLGNWSFGDYFKDEAIAWSFEFLTSKNWLDINPKNLYVTVFKGDADVLRDDQAISAWKKAFSSHAVNPISAEEQDDIYNFGGVNKIFPYDRNKNWWQAGETGPAGPDTEMFIDTDGDLPEEMRTKHAKWLAANPNEKEQCHVNCDCGRFIEIWNDVFMQFNGLGGGKYEPLKQTNVDTGMGLERVVAFLSGQQSVFDTDLFAGALQIILDKIGVISSTEQERKTRIIVDHLRASVFMVSDGVQPSNKERGYILRRILRRAFVHGKMLGMGGDWVKEIIAHYISFYASAYPDLQENSEKILGIILEEEQKFAKTLESGLKELEHQIAEGGNFTAAQAFRLFESFGIPVEISKEILTSQQQVKLSDNFDSEFAALFASHKENSRTAAAGMFKGGLADHDPKTVRMHTATHLMQAALRSVLGDHVFQKGSNVTSERTRFDFIHNEKMTPEQIAEVEQLVNKAIGEDLTVTHEEMSPDEARKRGALGVFGEKYGDIVSIYTIAKPDGKIISREFCGGPHVQHTGEIGKFKILKEEAVSAGVRRIKATIEP